MSRRPPRKRADIPTGDAYEDINGGTAYALTEITGQSFNTYALSASTSTSFARLR